MVAVYPHPPPYLHSRWKKIPSHIGISLVRETGIFLQLTWSNHLLASLPSPLTVRETWKVNVLPRCRCIINKTTGNVLAREKEDLCLGERVNLMCHVLEALKGSHLPLLDQHQYVELSSAALSPHFCLLLQSQDKEGRVFACKTRDLFQVYFQYFLWSLYLSHSTALFNCSWSYFLQ